MRARSKIVLQVITLGFAVAASAVSAQPKRDAQKLVAQTQASHAALLAQAPALELIDGAIRTDCSEKTKGHASTSPFCACASAVTMSLWRSGMNSKMVPRLNEFLKSPSESAAAEFLRFQGPELYRPLCELAEK